MSKIAIIGATGRAGSQLLEEALRRGHSVLAIARDPSALHGRAGVSQHTVPTVQGFFQQLAASAASCTDDCDLAHEEHSFSCIDLTPA